MDGAAWPAIDPGGPNGSDEPAVEPGVLGLDGSIAAVEVFAHASTLTPGYRHFSPKSDMAVSSSNHRAEARAFRALGSISVASRCRRRRGPPRPSCRSC